MHVVIVGAGRSAPRWPGGSRAPASEVTLVDQFEPGDRRATSGGETRLIRCSHGADADYTAMARRARTLWRELEAESGEELMRGVRRRLVRARRGRLGGGVRARTLAAQGIPVERLDAAEAARLYPSFRGDDLAFVLLEPEAGVLRAQRAVQALARQAQAHGARLVRGRARPGRRGGACSRTARGSRATPSCGRAAAGCAGLFRRARHAHGHAPGAAVRRRRAGVAAGVPAWVDYDRAMYGTGDLDGLGVKAALDVDGPPLDPDAELDDAPTTEPAVRAYLRDRFPALEHAPLDRGARVPLRAVAGLALHRRAGTPSTRASGCSAAAPATASSTARRWPSWWPPRSPAGAALPDRFALGPRDSGAQLPHGGLGCENLSAG